ncbi:EF-hand domain-containing protein [Henriciella marina]|uniref:EF-hand domain-containing protein n=1 Tax=Henriciella marina TaxID=453851 RepID=A0ABT4LUG2_9PROT|nr:EF-hand domain-containing protein [Henriciella marina]MCZ4297980.1 EF-hand domain-containing protein [Henriciella marina]
MKKLAFAATMTGILSVAAAGLAFADHHKDGDRSDRREMRTERMLERFDTNSDGVISTAEVDAMKAERFAAADTNGDGGLSLDEIEAFREAERERRIEKRMQRMFDRHDANGDGVISIDEFETRGMPMFERIDADGDGEITEAELSEMKGHRGHRRGGGHRRGERPVQE